MSKSKNEPIRRQRNANGQYINEVKEERAVNVSHTTCPPPSDYAEFLKWKQMNIASGILKPETHTGNLALGKLPSVEYPIDMGEPTVREPEVVVPIDSAIEEDYIKLLAFFDEPVTIMMERSQERNAPPFVPCQINGTGPEALVNGRWTKLNGHFMVGQVVTTKRKYLDQLAHAKTTAIMTDVLERDSEKPVNIVHRSPSMRAHFRVIEDKNPIGQEWLTRILATPG